MIVIYFNTYLDFEYEDTLTYSHKIEEYNGNYIYIYDDNNIKAIKSNDNSFIQEMPNSSIKISKPKDWLISVFILCYFALIFPIVFTVDKLHNFKYFYIHELFKNIKIEEDVDQTMNYILLGKKILNCNISDYISDRNLIELCNRYYKNHNLFFDYKGNKIDVRNYKINNLLNKDSK